MAKSSTTTTNPDWLHNPHAGELLAQEFMEPLGLTAEALSVPLGIEPARLEALIAGHTRIEADLDLRLGRYFKMSEGFFLRLQDQCELREAKRALNGELDKILPRAA